MWLAILLVAIGVYLLTGSPVLASLLPIAAVARPAVRSAFWLRSSDPLAGAAGSAFGSIWRPPAGAAAVALASLAATIVVLFATGRQPNLNTFVLTTIALVLSMTASSIMGLVGVASAWRTGVHVFVIPKLAWMCGGDFNAIAAVTNSYRAFNHARLVLVLSIFVPFIALVSVLNIMLFAGEHPKGPPPAGIVLLGVCSIVPIFTCIYVSRRVVALTPVHCWYDADWDWDEDWDEDTVERRVTFMGWQR